MSFIHDLIKPFQRLEDFLSCLYIFENYNDYSILTLVYLINKTTEADHSVNELEDLKRRYESFPDIYGKKIFKNVNLKQKLIWH